MPNRTEREKMLAGELYDPFDPELMEGREHARDLCHSLNNTRDRDADERPGQGNDGGVERLEEREDRFRFGVRLQVGGCDLSRARGAFGIRKQRQS